MNVKKIITTALLVFVAASVGYMIARENCVCSVLRQSAPPAAVQPQAIPLSDTGQNEPNQQIVVYYFHGDVRCPTCHKLEEYAKESLDTYCADDLAAGKIQWKPTNVDTPSNEHFVKDYELVTKSVILSRMVDGRQVGWKNLDQIWDLVSDKDKYLAYIRDSVSAFAAEGQK
ncbi:MAG: nitrophenyl compound nitroreductase subunit ArsF family protein [Sedimentisphaerales bacterium]|nr:nitrophenyl compound nitroreductase subunit ArsF family protein [Sedimentisphaerales bacterium]